MVLLPALFFELRPCLVFPVPLADRPHRRDERIKVGECFARPASLLPGEPRAGPHHRRFAGHDRFGQNSRAASSITVSPVGAKHHVRAREQAVVFARRQKSVPPDELDVLGTILFKFFERTAKGARSLVRVNCGLDDKSQSPVLDVALEERFDQAR